MVGSRASPCGAPAERVVPSLDRLGALANRKRPGERPCAPATSVAPGIGDHMTYPTDQETFWAGEFGDAYVARSSDDSMLAPILGFFANALRNAQPPASCIEFGANVGMNLRALKLLYPGQEQHAIEINPEAARALGSLLGAENVHAASILDFAPQRTWETNGCSTRNCRQGARAPDDDGLKVGRRPPRQDDRLRQEQRPRALHRRTIRHELSAPKGAFARVSIGGITPRL